MVLVAELPVPTVELPLLDDELPVPVTLLLDELLDEPEVKLLRFVVALLFTVPSKRVWLSIIVLRLLRLSRVELFDELDGRSLPPYIPDEVEPVDAEGRVVVLAPKLRFVVGDV